MGMIKHYFMPMNMFNLYFKDVENLQLLVKGIITDLDNTLVGWDVSEPTEAVKQWFEQAKEAGITVTIVSNNNKQRVGSHSH